MGVVPIRTSSTVLKLPSSSRAEQSPVSNVTKFPRLHIATYDSKRGIPVEERFRAIAVAITPTVFRYRRRELPDLAQTANLAEEAIYKANWALYGRPCENLAGYVFTIFKRDANECLQREPQIEGLDQASGCSSEGAGCVHTPEEIDRQVLLREALESMDEMTRWICLRRFIDEHSPETIGRELGISANSVSVKLSRGLAKVRALFSSNHFRK
jgi:DNA-directed RNA polymerase specialized sigma24 family protein